MAESHLGDAGVLIIRAWLEDHPDPLRIRILHTADLVTGEYRVATVGTATEAAAFVEAWLDAIGAGR